MMDFYELLDQVIDLLKPMKDMGRSYSYLVRLVSGRAVSSRG
jgi:hypothetical protein